MIKFITRLIGVIIILFMVHPVNADETIKGHYCYTYGDKESLKEAKDLTRTLAIRNAIESYRVYIESTTTVTNFTLTNDIIQIVSSGYLKNMKVVEHKEEGRAVCDTVEFTVSPREIEKAIKREIGGRTQKIEEKGIDNNGYLKILRVEESKQEIDKDGDKFRYVQVRAKILRKVDKNDNHLILFMTKYNSEGEEVFTERKTILNVYDVRTFYPGEIVVFDGSGIWESNAKSYRYWLLYDDEKIVNDISESKTPVRKKK